MDYASGSWQLRQKENTVLWDRDQVNLSVLQPYSCKSLNNSFHLSEPILLSAGFHPYIHSFIQLNNCIPSTSNAKAYSRYKGYLVRNTQDKIPALMGCPYQWDQAHFFFAGKVDQQRDCVYVYTAELFFNLPSARQFVWSFTDVILLGL